MSRIKNKMGADYDMRFTPDFGRSSFRWRHAVDGNRNDRRASSAAVAQLPQADAENEATKLPGASHPIAIHEGRTHFDCRPIKIWKRKHSKRCHVDFVPPRVSRSRYRETFVEGKTTELNVAKFFGNEDSAINYSYEVTGLPPGMTFNAETGKVTGTPAADASKGGIGGIYKPGTYMVRITEIDPETKEGRTKNVLVRVKADAEKGASTSVEQALADATVGVAYSADVPFSGGKAPYSNVRVSSGTLPPGLALENGKLTGTPTVGAEKGGAASDGKYALTLVSTDADGKDVETRIILNIKPAVPELEERTLEDARTGKTYSQDGLFDADGGPYTEAKLVTEAGTLPAGIVLNANGSLSGTPNDAAATGGANQDGNYRFIASAKDKNGTTVERIFTLRVKKEDNSSPNARVGTEYSYTPTYFEEAEVASAILANGELPKGLVLDEKTGTISGKPEPGTQDGGNGFGVYSFAIEVTNKEGTKVAKQISLTVEP